MTQQDLANFVGASRESVNKQLSQWEDNGYLKMKSGYIQIIQIDQLPG
jgi:CRP-like cAMP-binding protein